MVKRAQLVVVTRGEGWALAWPRDKWDALDDEEQRQVIARQVALLSQYVPQNRTSDSHMRGRAARTSGSPAGVLATI